MVEHLPNMYKALGFIAACPPRRKKRITPLVLGRLKDDHFSPAI